LNTIASRVTRARPLLLRARALAAACLLGTLAWSAFAASPADDLRARHAALAGELAANAFQRPIHLESTQTSGDLRGDIYAVVEHPFGVLDGALKGAETWCDILILHLNVKHCRASGGASTKVISLAVGKKYDQPVADAYRVDFNYHLAASTPDYLKMQLDASEGPMGTRDYRIFVEAIPLDSHRSFMHMSYAYGFGFAARMAMQAYLGTVGRDKVGFTVVARQGDKPVYVGNVRGVVERNTMRYYLAIDAYLDSLAAPPAQRQEHRLQHWFAATERYPRQLHELDEAEYLAMKRKEIARQQADAPVVKAS
jgi:hypothetical protein